MLPETSTMKTMSATPLVLVAGLRRRRRHSRFSDPRRVAFRRRPPRKQSQWNSATWCLWELQVWGPQVPGFGNATRSGDGGSVGSGSTLALITGSTGWLEEVSRSSDGRRGNKGGTIPVPADRGEQNAGSHLLWISPKKSVSALRSHRACRGRSSPPRCRGWLAAAGQEAGAEWVRWLRIPIGCFNPGGIAGARCTNAGSPASFGDASYVKCVFAVPSVLTSFRRWRSASVHPHYSKRKDLELLPSKIQSEV